MPNFVFTRGTYEIFGGTFVPGTADARMLLLTTSYAQDKDDNVVADLGNEISVSGYVRQTLAGETLTEDDTNDRSYMDATDPTFAGLTAGQTIGWSVMFRHTGSDASAPVIAGYDLTDTATNGGDVLVQFAAPASGGALYAAG